MISFQGRRCTQSDGVLERRDIQIHRRTNHSLGWEYQQLLSNTWWIVYRENLLQIAQDCHLSKNWGFTVTLCTLSEKWGNTIRLQKLHAWGKGANEVCIMNVPREYVKRPSRQDDQRQYAGFTTSFNHKRGEAEQVPWRDQPQAASWPDLNSTHMKGSYLTQERTRYIDRDNLFALRAYQLMFSTVWRLGNTSGVLIRWSNISLSPSVSQSSGKCTPCCNMGVATGAKDGLPSVSTHTSRMRLEASGLRPLRMFLGKIAVR